MRGLFQKRIVLLSRVRVIRLLVLFEVHIEPLQPMSLAADKRYGGEFCLCQREESWGRITDDIP